MTDFRSDAPAVRSDRTDAASSAQEAKKPNPGAHQMTSPEMREDLLPCPFCGSDDLTLDNLGDNDSWSVDCKSCKAQQPSIYWRHSAIAAWNRRDLPPPPSVQSPSCTDTTAEEAFRSDASRKSEGSSLAATLERLLSTCMECLDDAGGSLGFQFHDPDGRGYAALEDAIEALSSEPDASSPNDFCEDEGCPHAGTLHICNPVVAEPSSAPGNDAGAASVGTCALGEFGCVCWSNFTLCDHWRAKPEPTIPLSAVREVVEALKAILDEFANGHSSVITRKRARAALASIQPLLEGEGR